MHNIVGKAYFFFFLSYKPLWFKICGKSSFDFDYETLKATLRWSFRNCQDQWRSFQDRQWCSTQPSACGHITWCCTALSSWGKVCYEYTHSIIDTCGLIYFTVCHALSQPSTLIDKFFIEKKILKPLTTEKESLPTPTFTQEGLHKACTWLVTLTRANRLFSKGRTRKKTSTSLPRITDTNAINCTNNQTFMLIWQKYNAVLNLMDHSGLI